MKKISVFLLLIFLPALLWAGEGVYNTDGVAVNGYDVVAYFTDSAAVEGNAMYVHSWDGVTWHFSNQENRDAFAADPERYAPQYGGFCAFAVAQGSLAPTDPQAWTVYNDKLYLNYSLPVRERWSQNKDNFIVAGDRYWDHLGRLRKKYIENN